MHLASAASAEAACAEAPADVAFAIGAEASCF